jgi:diguanylate cyclase (GGDEF)-like protein
VEELQAENARLRELSLVDPLTGLHNYRYFLEQIDVEMERVRRTGAPCALLMLDLDLFKQVNDAHGHEAGNAVLKEAAAVIKAGTRAMDIACRYGGEEFAVILPATNLEGAVKMAERIRRSVKRKNIEHAATPIQVTLSAGAACFGYLDRLSRAEFIELADTALYQAKRGGRDRVCSAATQAPPTEVGPAEKEALK